MHNTNGQIYVHICKTTMENAIYYRVGLQDESKPKTVGSYDGFNKRIDDIIAISYAKETYARKGEVIPFVLPVD